jgi:hypothetical protein
VNSADGSKINHEGNLVLDMTINDRTVRTSFVVIPNLQCDVLIGLAFCKEHRATSDCTTETIELEAACKGPKCRRKTTLRVLSDVTIPSFSAVGVDVQLYGSLGRSKRYFIQGLDRLEQTGVCVIKCITTADTIPNCIWVVNFTNVSMKIKRGRQLATLRSLDGVEKSEHLQTVRNDEDEADEATDKQSFSPGKNELRRLAYTVHG